MNYTTMNNKYWISRVLFLLFLIVLFFFKNNHNTYNNLCFNILLIFFGGKFVCHLIVQKHYKKEVREQT